MPPGSALADHRIDDHPEIVDRGEAIDGDRAGLRIDLDLADLAAVGIVRRAARRAGIGAGGLQAQAEFEHRSGRRVERLGDVGHRHRLVGADHGELAVLELDVVVGRLQQRARHPLRLVDDGVGRDAQRHAADHGAAGRERAAAERTWSVSPWMYWMASNGTPSHSETSCANAVAWPCPCECVPAMIETMPLGSKRSSMRSLNTPPSSI